MPGNPGKEKKNGSPTSPLGDDSQKTARSDFLPLRPLPAGDSEE